MSDSKTKIIKQVQPTDSFKGQLTTDNLFEGFLHKCKQIGNPANEVELVTGNIRNKYVNVDPLYRNSSFFRKFLIEKVLPKIPGEPWQGMKILSDDLKRHAAVAFHTSVKIQLLGFPDGYVVSKKNSVTTHGAIILCTFKDWPEFFFLRLHNVYLNSYPACGKSENLPKKREIENSVIAEEKIRQHYNIRKLEKSMNKISLQIHRLDEEEVDSSDDENSSYMRASRYRRKFCELFNKICELKNETQAEKMMKFSGTEIPVLNKAIEQYCNYSRNFPDYHTIFQIVKSTNDEENLGLLESQIHKIAERTFEELGCTMKLQRHRELQNILSSYSEVEEKEDPALQDPELNRKLLENQKLYGHKIDDIINEYVTKQEEYHLSETLKSDTNGDLSSSEDEEVDEEEDETFESSFLSDSTDTSTSTDLEEETPGVLLNEEKNPTDSTIAGATDQQPIQNVCQNIQPQSLQNICEFNGPCCSKNQV